MKKIRFVFLLLFLNIVSQLSAETEIVLNDTSKATNAISSSLILDNDGSSDLGRPVPANEAFELSAILTGSHSLSVKWNIKKNYYLYKDKISFAVEEATIKDALYPEATIKNDEFFGEVSVYTSPLEIQIEVEDELSQFVILAVEHQGCWEGGVCYPPQVDRLKVSTIGAERITGSDRPTATDSEKITSKKFEQGGITLFLAAFLAGLALSWTPCVYPMVPILSGIIIGQKEAPSNLNAILMSVTFVFSMSLAYGLIGASAGYFGAGINLQALMQTPWILFVSSLIFIALALSMFGLYDIQLPSKIQTKLTNLSNAQSGGSFVGVSIMGFLSALIVGPCVTPFLATALSYVIAGGSAAKGGASLFAMGLGMGVPLIIICGWGVNTLPKAGAWMENVKRVFGFAMIAVALYLLDRILYPFLSLILWALLFSVAPVMLGVFKNLNKSISPLNILFKLLSLAVLAYGFMLWFLVAKGNGDVQQPLDSIIYGDKIDISNSIKFQIINDEERLDNLILSTNENNKMLVIKFYAEWCIACNKMERVVFTDTLVSQSLRGSQAYTVDVTDNNTFSQSILSRFSLFGPPAILFFKNGKELRDQRIIGEVNAAELTKHLNNINSL
ncbi:protein-disulfide reductase DsbD [Candidatus Pseudothioglobus singularis]|nr:protein-disulfide reductase DsbD [Candidatus Pseudothioglobus singularis]